jgi:YD repeat-containing protein
MKDLLFFVCFLWIFLCAFSITSWALISSASQVHWVYDEQGRLINVTRNEEPNQQRTWRIIRELINHGVWKIFGQVDPIGEQQVTFIRRWSTLVSSSGNRFLFGRGLRSDHCLRGHCQCSSSECARGSFQVKSLFTLSSL